MTNVLGGALVYFSDARVARVNPRLPKGNFHANDGKIIAALKE